MGRRKKGRAVSGMLMLNKGLNQSSNEALQQVKRLFGAAKAGHTGALDPLATGICQSVWARQLSFLNIY